MHAVCLFHPPERHLANFKLNRTTGPLCTMTHCQSRRCEAAAERATTAGQ